MEVSAVQVQVLLTESELANQLAAAFATRRLPEKFFYWFPLSVRAWLALCGDGAYRNFSRSRALIERHAADIARALSTQHPALSTLEVCSLGSGQGDKDLLLLEALHGAGHRVSYFPADSSQTLLEMALEAAAGRGFRSRGVKLDLAEATHLKALRAGRRAPPRLFLLLGNTLGAFDPLEMPARLAALLRPQDRLLVDGEVFSEQQTMAGYDNPSNRQFAFAPLAALGVRESDGKLVFESHPDPRLPGLHYVTKHFRPARWLELMVAGQRIELGAGTRVEMNFSYKYSAETFLGLLERAGLRVEAQFLSDDGCFLMALAGGPPCS